MAKSTVINFRTIKTEVLCFGFFILFSLGISSCKSDQLTAQDIVEKSIENHGGLKNWKNIKQFSFDKQTTLFYEDGSVELSTDQFQLFRLQPSLFGKIEWENNGNDLAITYEDGTISKTINDTLVMASDELEKAKSSFFAAFYVVQQPFELLHDDVTLFYEGEKIIEGQNLHVIRVQFKDDTEDADVWTYYFDTKTFELKANKVELTDHTSWVENLTFNTDTDLKFNAHRKSYRLNKAEEKTYLRAEYFYSNFSVLYQE